MSPSFPVYQINQFKSEIDSDNFYANHLNPHVKGHQFAELPHKHDFYLTIYVTKGSGTHQIDFENYDVTPGTVFFMKPGQMHSWLLSEDIDGFVFFHSKAFYDKYFVSFGINEFNLFKSYQKHPLIEIDKSVNQLISPLFETLIIEYRQNAFMKWHKIHSAVHLIYIELARVYTGTPEEVTEVYLEKLNEFEAIIELYFKKTKFPKDYAGMLNITEKHLNRITKSSLNKTCTEFIADRIILEAKRMLSSTNMPVNLLCIC